MAHTPTTPASGIAGSDDKTSMHASHSLTETQRKVFAHFAICWAIDHAVRMALAINLPHHAHWMGRESYEEAAVREQFQRLADKAADRAKQISIYAMFGSDSLAILRSDRDMAEYMDELRTDEDMPHRRRKPSIDIINEWIDLAVNRA